MTTELYNNWITALTSGKYTAGNDMLRDRKTGHEDLYCCLGVVCDLSKLGRWEISVDEEEFYYRTDDNKDITVDAVIELQGASNDNLFVSMHYLPNDVQHELNLRTNDGTFSFGELSEELRDIITENLTFALDFSRSDSISLANINDEYPAQIVFEVVAKILEERPQSLFRPEPAPQSADS